MLALDISSELAQQRCSARTCARAYEVARVMVQ
jgi:hypothetical protein